MKPNSVKARIMAGDWHDKTIKEIAAELNCCTSSVTHALEDIEADTGEPVPHKSGIKGDMLVINGKEYTLTEALLESDWSDMTAPQIADVLGVKPERVMSAFYRYRNATGKDIPHIKSKRGPKPKERKPKPEEPDPPEEPLEDSGLLRIGGDWSKAGISAEDAAETGKLLAEAALASTKVPLEPEEGAIDGPKTMAELVKDKEENNMELKDYTPEQLMVRGATDLVCRKYSDCAEGCPMWTIDGGKRPANCLEYAIRYPAEALKALGVELPESLTPELRTELEVQVGWLRDEKEELERMLTELHGKMGNAVETKAAPMTRAECLDKAKECVCGQRQQDYGSPEDNFAVIARLWADYLDCEIDNLDVANMMVLFKMGRIKTGTATADSYVDIAGYAACGCEIATAEIEVWA